MSHQSALPPTASAAAATARVRRTARAKARTPEADVAQVTSSRGRGSWLGGGAIEVPCSIVGRTITHRAAAPPAALRPQHATPLGGEPHMSTRPSPRSRPPAPADDDDADDANKGISARASSYLGMQTGVVWERGGKGQVG